MRTAAFDFELLDRMSGHKAVADAACPACGPDCKSPANQRRKVLRIWNDGEFITYKCARCDAAGYAKPAGSIGTRPSTQPVSNAPPEKDKSELAAYLWGQSAPLAGTVGEAYLASRGCLIQSDALRFLPARGEHPPAMIARFGGAGKPTGVHLTKLKPDGSGKAGTEKDKIMIGPSQGQPIVVVDNPEREELIIAEGIEDAATLAVVMGWSAWAAGSAGRLSHIVAIADASHRIYLAVDDDLAGRRALQASRALRPDIVPINLSKVLSHKAKTDANAALREFGADVIIASIEWCDAQARFAQGEICFEAMMRAASRSQDVFRGLMEDAL